MVSSLRSRAGWASARNNEQTTFELDIWHAGSSRHYVGQVWRSRSGIKAHSHMRRKLETPYFEVAPSYLAFENGRFSEFQALVTLTLDRVIVHTVMHHSSTSTYIPNIIEIEETFCGRTDGRTDGYLRPACSYRSTRRSRPNKWKRGI